MDCKNCGSEINLVNPPGKRGPKPIYCSDNCRRESNNKRQLDYFHKSTKFKKICKHCKIDFYSYREDTKYCSTDCAHKSKRTLIGTLRKCLNCGNKFEPSYKENKYCSLSCASRHKLYKVTSTKSCINCGKLFEVLSNNQFGLYCSKKCGDKHYKQLNPDKEHNKRARYRTKKNNNTVEEVSFEYICERDNWKCQICGKRVSKLKKWPHPLSPSLDHIMPISLGGAHSITNIQLTHLKCNLSKQASVGYQLRLTG